MLLDVVDLSVAIGSIPLLQGVTFELGRGQSLALVGESGSGKTTLALALMRLLPRGADISGTARLEGVELLDLSERAMRAQRGRRIAMVFQEPLRALDPLMRVGRQIGETGADVGRLLAQVDLPPTVARAFAHELSGGQRQRVLIASALAAQPALLIADEASTALDAGTQARILALLGTLCRERGMGLLLISHDLGLVAGEADRLAVLYGGRLVEIGPTRAVLDHPAHPYTAALAACSLHLGAHTPQSPLPTIAGTPALPGDDLPGCRFAPRCPRVQADCLDGEPPLRPVADARAVACLHPL